MCRSLEHPYPPKIYPIKSKPIRGYDICDGRETTVLGYYLDGKYYIQEVIENDTSKES